MRADHRHRRVEQRRVDLALRAQRRLHRDRVQRRVGKHQQRRPVRRAREGQPRAGQRRCHHDHQRTSASRRILVVSRRLTVDPKAEQHVAVAGERGHVAECGGFEFRTVTAKRVHAGGLKHHAGVVLVGGHQPDREGRGIGDGGARDLVLRRVGVYAAHLGLIAQRAQTHCAAELVGTRRGRGLQVQAGHCRTTAERIGLDRMGERTVEAEADGVGLGVRSARRRCGGVDVDEHVVAVEAQIGHRHVPAERRQRFAHLGGLRAVRAGVGGTARAGRNQDRREHDRD